MRNIRSAPATEAMAADASSLAYEAPSVNPRIRHHRSSAELARLVRRGQRYTEALNALSDRADQSDTEDLRLADELARVLVRRCDTRHTGWQNVRDTLQDAGAEIPWARAGRHAYGPTAERILADCATPGRSPLVRVQHAAAEERARALVGHLDPATAGAQLGAPELTLDRDEWATALVAAVRARSRAGVPTRLREAAQAS